MSKIFPSKAQILIYPDSASLAIAAVERIVAAYQAARRAGEQFIWFLAGGSTPEVVYRILSASPYRQQVDWDHVQVFFGDERCVPSEHPYSNFRMARAALLETVPLPPANIHRIQGELGREAAAARYEARLREQLPITEGYPLLHLAMLGLGPDGHTASLFPGSPAVEETRAWAAAVAHEVPPEPLVDRVTVTLPLLNAARQALFLVQGAAKSARVGEILGGNAPVAAYPAGRVNPAQGELVWILDRAAAGKLEDNEDLAGT